MSLHISTFGMRLPNIARVAVFTELICKKLLTALQENSIIDNIANKRSFSLRMLEFSKFNKKTGEHVCIKKPVKPKDGTLFDFMIRLLNDESEVVKSTLLNILKAEIGGCYIINNVTTNAEFELVETLLQEASIEWYSLSYSSENFPDKFSLSRISPLHCPLCDQEHTSDNAYIRQNKKSYSFFCYCANQDKQPGTKNPSLKLTINETALDREKKLLSPTKLDQSRISDPNDCFAAVACIQTTLRLWVLKIEDTNGGLYFDMAPKLDLAKCFNSPLQARKLIVMNETGMSSTEWHRFNGYLKSLITEGMVSIECKGIETKRLKDFTRWMVTSNQDALPKIDIGDFHVVCFDVSPRCRENIAYFKRLEKVLDHPDAPGVVMRYLLSHDLSDFKPEEISATKMKSDIMREQLPNPIQFIIDHISLWSEDQIAKPSCTSLYQNYVEWCGGNGEKPFSNNILINETTDIPIFNVSTISPKITLLQPVEITPPSSSKGKKNDQDNSIQALFDYSEQAEVPIAFTSGTSKTTKASEPPKPVIDELETNELPESIEPICEVVNTPPKEIPTDSPKPNEVSSAILLTRAQREERLRKGQSNLMRIQMPS
ncbi:hypothetical protein RclHR1_15570003 [Rhizophagus clarus]|uniref:NrS-1 polymerase-like helicase domain-containing protein n=1 Tax=Rhizophagus clarus TaxID=94130 RepID=A0A2Z6QFG1_9GLOM|nr:hypothetical protein RclHR1_15570003 [Rhizophagus clarus]